MAGVAETSWTEWPVSAGFTHARLRSDCIFATTVTADDASIDQVIEAAKVVMDNRDHWEARCLGVISRDRIW